MKRLFRKVTGIAISISLFFCMFASSIYAADKNETSTDTFAERVTQAYTIVQGHVEVSQNIDQLGFNTDQINAIRDLVGAYNEMLGKGYLVIKNNQLASTDKLNDLFNKANSANARSSQGINAFKPNGGPPMSGDMYLNNTIASKFAAGIGTAATLSAFIPEPIVSKALAASLAIYSGAIGIANNGKGVIISMYSNIPYWIRGQ